MLTEPAIGAITADAASNRPQTAPATPRQKHVTMQALDKSSQSDIDIQSHNRRRKKTTSSVRS